MLKRIFVSLLVLILIFVSVYLFRYKSGHCVCDTIPSDSTAVLFLNTRNLEQHFINDMISNPFSYLKSGGTNNQDHKIEEDSVRPQRISIMDGLDLPGKLVFSKINGRNNVWESNSIKIKKLSVVEAYLKQNGFLAKSKSNVYSKGSQIAIIESDEIKFQYSEVLGDSSNRESTYLKQGDKIFDFITNSDSDITYIDLKGNFIELNFNTGNITIDGKYDFAFLNDLVTELNGEAIAQVSANIDLDKLLEDMGEKSINDFENFTKLNVDSLFQFWDGQLLASINNLSTVSDTIKTYEYDDDFNKVEVKKVETITSLDYNVCLDISSEGAEYMYRKKAIVEESNMQVLAIMPLVKTYCELNSFGVNFYTSNKEVSTQSSDLKFKLSLKLQDLFAKEANDFFSIPNQLSMFEDIESINLTIDKSNVVEGELEIDGSRNALVSLLQ